MRKVPFFNYPAVYEDYAEKFQQALKDVGSRGAFIMQDDLARFEADLADYTGAAYVVGVANATDGLQMAMMAGKLPPGGEVIISSHTMIATASAIHFAGGVPVPVEAGSDHLIDIDSAKQAISERTVAVCPTQLNGRTCNMDSLLELAKTHNLTVYEDAAQALGSKFRGKSAGTFGVASCISFYPAKVLGALGDAGAVLTNDKEVYRTLMLLRDHGRNAKGELELWGFNSRMDNLHAAFLNIQLKDYPNVVKRRREIAARYHAGLKDLQELKLPPAPDQDPDHFDIYQNYEIEAERRDDLKKHLSENGIGTLIQWSGQAVHHAGKLGFDQSLPYTDGLFEKMLMLPLNMSLQNEDIDYVIEQIRSFYGAFD